MYEKKDRTSHKDEAKYKLKKVKQKIKNDIKDKLNETIEDIKININEQVDAMEEKMDELQETMKDTAIGLDNNENEHFDVEKPAEDNEKAEFIDMIMYVVHAIITIILTIEYWDHRIPDLEGKSFKTHLICRAAHFTVLPLYKPISITMWPALMPLMQFVHWQAR